MKYRAIWWAPAAALFAAAVAARAVAWSAPGPLMATEGQHDQAGMIRRGTTATLAAAVDQELKPAQFGREPVVTDMFSTTAKGIAVGSIARGLPLVKRDLPPVEAKVKPRHMAAPKGRELYRDDFSEPRSGWPVGENDFSKRAYVDGEYLVSLKQQFLLLSRSIGYPVDDFGLQIEFRAANATTPVAGGLVFADSPPEVSPSNTIYFSVQPLTGQFSLFQQRDDQTIVLMGWTPSSAIRGGIEKNLLRVERRGAEVRLIINGTTVATPQIAHLAPDLAGIGTFHPGGLGTADALYDNILLETLDDSAAATPTRATPTGSRPTPTATRRTTPQPTLTPKATPTPIRSPFTEIALQDDFSRSDSGWRVYHSDDYVAEYRAGQYHLQQQVLNGHWPVWHPLEVVAFDFQVSARLERDDPDHGLGIVFGKQDRPAQHFYYAFVNPTNGTYGLVNFGETAVYPVPITHSDAIQPGTSPNHLRLIYDGRHARFLINNTPVFKVDLAIPLGHVGFGVSNGTTSPGVSATFDDVLITTPVGGASAVPDFPVYEHLLAQDDFSDPASGWRVSRSVEAVAEYTNGEYHLGALVSGRTASAKRNLGSEAFDFSCDARAAPGNDGTLYGLAFAAGPSGNGLEFLIDSTNGTYSVYGVDGKNRGHVLPPTESLAIKRGTATNRLRVVLTRDHVFLLVNDVRLATLRLLIRDGMLGFSVWNVGGPNGGAHTYFDNFRISRRDGAAPTLPAARPTQVDPEVLFFDAFDNPSSGWPAQGGRSYESETYRLTVPSGSGGLSSVAPRWFPELSQFDVGVQTQIIDSSPSLGYRYSGLLFGHLIADDTGYLFVVDPFRREYRLMRLIQGREDAFPVVNWTYSPAIRPAGAFNHLRAVRRQGTELELYVNGQLQTTVALPYNLAISGVTASQSFGDRLDGFSAAFDDFEIRRIDPSISGSRSDAKTPTPLHDSAANPVVTVSPAASRSVAAYLPLIARGNNFAEAPGSVVAPAPTSTPAPLPDSGGATLRANFSNPNALTALALDSPHDDMWAGSHGGGLVRWDIKTGTYTRFTSPRDLPDDRVLALARGNDGTLWIGTGGGAMILPPGASVFQPVEWAPGQRLTGQVSAIHIAPDGTPWLAVAGAGVFHRAIDGTWQRLADGAPEAVTQAVSLAVDRVGDLWVGSAGTGVARLQASDGQWRTYRAESPTTFRWSGGILTAATRELLNSPRLAPLGQLSAKLIGLGEGCRDVDPPAEVDGNIVLLGITAPCPRLNTMLATLAARGAVTVIVYDGSEAFTASDYFLDATTSVPGLWISGAQGRSLMERLTAGRDVVQVDLPERLPTDFVTTIKVDPLGNRWIGHRASGRGVAGAMNGGVVVASADGAGWQVRSRWRQLNPEDTDPEYSTGTLVDPRDQVFAFAFDDSGGAWIGTGGGLEKLDKRGRPIGVEAGATDSLAGDHIRALQMTSSDELWVATDDGLSRMATKSDRWTTFKADASIGANWVQASAADRFGDKWFAGGYDALRNGVASLASDPGATVTGVSHQDRVHATWSHPLAVSALSLFADPLRDLLWLGDSTGTTRLDTISGRTWRELEGPVVWAEVAGTRPQRLGALEAPFGKSAGRVEGELALWGDLCTRSTPIQPVRGKIVLAPTVSATCRYEPRLMDVQRQGALAVVAFDPVGSQFFMDTLFSDPQLMMPIVAIHQLDGLPLQSGLQQGKKITVSLHSAAWRPLGVLNATDRYDFATDSKGNLWAGGVDSLDRRSPEGTWTNYHSRNSGLGLLGQNNPGVRAVAVDSHDNKWLGTERAGAIRLAADNTTWTPFTAASTSGAIPDKPITDIAVDPKDNVWFVTAGAGVRRLAADLKSWTSFTRDSTYSTGSSGSPGGGGAGSLGSSGLPSDTVSVVQPAPDGATWFGTASGLARLASDLKTWTTLPTAAPVTTLLFDHLGDLWFGTAGLGLTQLSRREPGADCATAMPLSPGAVVDTALDNQADIDLYAVKVNKPFSRIELTVPDAEHQLDLFLRRSCIGIGSNGRHIGSNGRHIGSNGRHIGSEQRLVFDVLAETGTYYVDVRPRIGAQDKPIPYRLRSGLTPVDLDSRRTLILTDASAVRNAFGLAADSAEYLAWLDALASLQADSTVGGLVITDLKTETNESVRKTYTAWLANQDAAQTNELANDVALALRDWIWQRKTTDMPRLQYVVLAGDDRILPHFRLAVTKPSADTGWQPESAYLANAGIDPDSTIGAALAADMTLTDDVFGAAAPAGYPAAPQLHVPELAIGRLVERPGAMTKVIQSFFDRHGAAPLTSSLVAGSGAFQDAARIAAGTLAESGLPASRRAELIGSAWTQLDLQRSLLTEERTFVVADLPGDHASLALPGGRRFGSDSLRLSAQPLTGTLALMLASHSGLNAPGPNHPRPLDWPEAWLAQGAALIAPTSYAYGLDGDVHFAAKIEADFVRLAVQGDGRVIGDALVEAKQEYLADAAQLGPFDAATVAGLILYGLPMARLEVTTPPAAPAAGALAADWGADAASDADRADGRTASVPVEIAPGTWAVTVSQAVAGLEKKDGPAGSWYTMPGAQPRLVAGVPVQPQLRVDVPELQVAGTGSGSGGGGTSAATAGAALPLRSVLWLGGRTRPIADFTPWWLGALASSFGAAVGQPTPNGRWEPAVPVSLRASGESAGAAGLLVASQSGRLLYAAGQLEGGGAERLFDDIASEEFYSAAEDLTPPEVSDVKVETRGGELEVSAKVEDRAVQAAGGGAAAASGVLKMLAVWTKPGANEWRAVELTADGSGTWRGRMPAGAVAVVEAADKAGNVRVDDNGGWLW